MMKDLICINWIHLEHSTVKISHNSEWKATSIGKNFKQAKNFLEKRYSEEMELEEGIHNILLALKEGYEGEMNSKNIEIAIVGEDKKFRKLTPAEIQNYLDELE